MTVPYIFADASQSIPLSELDANFAAVGNADNIEYNPPFANSTVETVTAKLSQTVSVKDFGAVGDGLTDDTAAIQAALDCGAKKIYLPDGTYNFTKLLIRGNNIEFYGSGNSTVLNATDNTKFCAIGLVENYSYIYLHDFKLQGAITSEPSGPSPYRGIVNGTNTTGTAHSILTWNAFNRMQRLHITGTNPGTNGFNLGIQNNKASYSTIQDCVIESIYGISPSFGYCIVSNGLGHQILFNRFLSTISGQGRHAVYLTDIPISQKVIGNYCNGFQNEGITSNCAPGAYDLSIINNTLINCLLTDTGTSASVIDILGAPRSKVIGNTINGSNRSGITISGVAPSCIVADNTIQNTVAWGIYCVDGSDNTQIINNLIDAPDYNGTNTYGGIEIVTSNYVYVSGNRIGGTNYLYGIRFNSTSPVPTYCQLFDNNITGIYTYEIENASQSLTNSIRQILSQPKQLQYTTGATSIDVSQNVRTVFGIQNGSTTAITALTGAYPGQIVTLVFFDTVTSVTAGALITLSGGSFTATNKSSLTLAYYNDNAGWYEIGRSTNVS